jgi:hypothetical protein
LSSKSVVAIFSDSISAGCFSRDAVSAAFARKTTRCESAFWVLASASSDSSRCCAAIICCNNM